MAATIAKATGYDKQRVKETHRLGSEAATAQADTWDTFTTAHVGKDGAGYTRVTRGNHTVQVAFGPESGDLLDVLVIRIDGRVLTLAVTHPEEG